MAKGYYFEDGEPTDTLFVVHVVVRLPRKSDGPVTAVEFGPLALEAPREKMVAGGCSRTALFSGDNAHLPRIQWTRQA